MMSCIFHDISFFDNRVQSNVRLLAKAFDQSMYSLVDIVFIFDQSLLIIDKLFNISFHRDVLKTDSQICSH